MTLHLVTWNIFYGKNLATILETMQTNTDFSDLDIFALQEASVHEGTEDAKRIAACLGNEYAYYQQTAQVRGGMPQANALVWNTKKVHISHTEVVSLPNYRAVQIGRVEKTLKHLIKKETRNAIMIEGFIGETSVRVYTAHFDVIGFSLKTAQLTYLLEDNQKRKTVDFACVVGDLNTFKIIKRPRWIRLQEAAKLHGFIDITTHIEWTFHRKALRYRQKTDAIFLQNTKQGTYSSWSKNVIGSDHIPIFANIQL